MFIVIACTLKVLGFSVDSPFDKSFDLLFSFSKIYTICYTIVVHNEIP